MAEEEEFLDDDRGSDLGGGDETSERSKLITLLIWIGTVLVGLIVVTLISYFVSKYVREEQYKEEQNIVVAPAPPPLNIFKFTKEFRVNTADTESIHFIQLSLAFGYDGENKKLEYEFVQRQIQMKHIINIMLSGKKKEELSTSLQKINLREEIKSQINIILRNGQIDEVYFEEFVVS